MPAGGNIPWSRSPTTSRTVARCELAGHHSAWAGGKHLHLPRRAHRAFLPRVPRPDLAGEAPRPRHRHRQALGLPLKIAAKVDAADAAYFREIIEPLLDDPLVEFIGEIGDSEKSAFLGNAKALLFPIDWPEPFGLVMIEAMACGTPVVAWRCGSVPEIVDHGETGFIVATEEESVEALERLHLIDRRRVRDVFEQRFTATVMARNYLRLYWRLYAGSNRVGGAAQALPGTLNVGAAVDPNEPREPPGSHNPLRPEVWRCSSSATPSAISTVPATASSTTMCIGAQIWLWRTFDDGGWFSLINREDRIDGRVHVQPMVLSSVDIR